ncbi:MAG: hypothetical protein ACYTFO_00445, partial [Planctomycetota bacterium]
MHRPRTALVIVCIAAVSLPPASLADEPATQPAELPFTISPETTYFTEPLNEDGTVNYIAAVNAVYAEGVTPDNNAAPLLIQVSGIKGFTLQDVSEQSRERWTDVGIVDLPQQGLYVDIFQLRPDWGPEERYEGALKGPWRASQKPEIAEWLAANEEALALAAEAAQRERFFVPHPELVGETDESPLTRSLLIVPLSAYRNIARAFVCRANLSLGEGDLEQAFEDFCTAYRLGTLVGQEPTLIADLVAAAIISVSCDAMVDLAAMPLTTEQAQSLLETWQGLPPGPAPWQAVDELERLLALD